MEGTIQSGRQIGIDANPIGINVVGSRKNREALMKEGPADRQSRELLRTFRIEVTWRGRCSAKAVRRKNRMNYRGVCMLAQLSRVCDFGMRVKKGKPNGKQPENDA